VVQQGYEPKYVEAAMARGPHVFRLDGEAGDEFGDLESPKAPPPVAAPPAAVSAGAGLTDEEFSKQWLMGLASDRTLGRPKEWNGKEEGFDTFAFRFSNWLGSMPGNAEELFLVFSCRLQLLQKHK